jgi:hypothetical protein
LHKEIIEALTHILALMPARLFFEMGLFRPLHQVDSSQTP